MHILKSMVFLDSSNKQTKEGILFSLRENTKKITKEMQNLYSKSMKGIRKDKYMDDIRRLKLVK